MKDVIRGKTPVDAPSQSARISFLLPGVVGLVALIVYLRTLAPSVTWKHDGADSGDLIAAAFTLGIPHPPGYPLFTLLASPFAHLPFFEPAAGVGILVAVLGALVVVALALVGADLISPKREERGLGLVAPLAALGFALSPALWSQATIVEVYTLNLFFVAIILWAMVSSNRHRIPIAAAAFGFGLAHHLSIILFAPGALLALKPTRRDIRSLPLAVAPLILYAYLPIRAAYSPAVNWGNPVTLDGFFWLVTAAPYRSYLFGLSLPDIVSRVEFAARLLFQQFTAPGVALALWGLFRLGQFRSRLAAGLELSATLVVAYSVVYSTRDSFIYLLPAFAIVFLWLVYGAGDVARLLQPVAASGSRRSRSAPKAREPGKKWLDRARGTARLCLFAGLILLPAYNAWTNFTEMDVSADREAFNYAQGVVDKVPRDTVIFADKSEWIFPLVYYRHTIAYRTSGAVIVSQGLLQYPWYYDELTWMMNEVKFAPVEGKTDYLQRAVEIINVTFAEGRPVCFTQSSPLIPEFVYESRYGLSCVVAERK